MVQMLPNVLKLAANHPKFSVFLNGQHNRLDNIINAFNHHGELCSLCYTSEVHTNFEKYLELLRQKAQDSIVALDELDYTVIPTSRRGRSSRTRTDIPEETLMFGQQAAEENADLDTNEQTNDTSDCPSG
ncbi:hypothetical protein G6F56_013324 [Rhizopus delemar]|nr:hypothetical protein G6F56_013324 [Rhizopus delemar]